MFFAYLGKKIKIKFWKKKIKKDWQNLLSRSAVKEILKDALQTEEKYRQEGTMNIKIENNIN